MSRARTLTHLRRAPDSPNSTVALPVGPRSSRASRRHPSIGLKVSPPAQPLLPRFALSRLRTTDHRKRFQSSCCSSRSRPSTLMLGLARRHRRADSLRRPVFRLHTIRTRAARLAPLHPANPFRCRLACPNPPFTVYRTRKRALRLSPSPETLPRRRLRAPAQPSRPGTAPRTSR